MSNPPVNAVPGAQTVAEDATLTFSTANSNLISVSDDVSTTLTVSISAANGRFALSRTTGLTFSAGINGGSAMTFSGTIVNINTALAGARYFGNANFNGDGSVVIVTTDQDTPALTDTDTIAITVTARNDAPVAIGGSSNILLNGTKVFSLADFPFTDVEGNALSAIIVQSASGGLTFDADGAGGNAPTAVTVGQTISAGDITAGKLVFTAVSAINTYLFSYKIQDNGGTANGGADTSSSAALRTLYTVNIPPVVNAGPDVAVTSGTATALTGLSVSDDNATLTATFSVANGALTLRTDVVGGLTAGSIVSGVNGSDIIIVRGTPAEINATLSASNGLTYLGTNADTLTLRVSDATNATANSLSNAFQGGAASHSVAIADVNGDARLDIIATDFSNGVVNIATQSTNGSFSVTASLGVQNAVDAIVTNTNPGTDSFPDLLVASLSGNLVASFRNSGTGTFTQTQSIGIGQPNAIVAGDFNGDGLKDFATANRIGNLSVALNNGSGGYSTPTTYATSGYDPTNWDIETADLDEDGDLDLLVSSGGPVSGTAGGVYLLRGNGNGTFAAPSAIAAVAGAGQIAIADFNNDGHLDFAVASYGGNGATKFFTGTGTGTFSTGVTLSTNQTLGLVAGDFNRDGIIDIIAGGPGGSLLFNGSGDGTFGFSLNAGALWAGAAADVDGDGDLDIAQATINSTFIFNRNLSPAGVGTDQAQITIAPVNQAPTAAPVTLTAIAEDSGARIITAAELLAGVTDADGPALSITAFTLTSGNGTLVDNGNGTWSYTPAANDDTAAAFAYTVSDGSLSAGSTASLDITPVGDAPVITSNGGLDTASLSVAENTAAVTTVTATDPDLGDTVVFQITGGVDAALFDIDAATGALSFIATPDFETPTDVGTDNIYNVIVTASDGTLTDTQAIAVSVTDENDNAPVITSNGGLETAAVSVAEDGTAVTTVTATDADAGTTVVYAITGGVDAGKFAIDADTGELTFLLAPNFEAPTDVGADNIYDVIVSVSDGTLPDSLTDTQAIAVTVTDGPDTLTGTEDADNLIGTNGTDIIFGLGGNDTINGGNGRDTMVGGAGDDTYILDLNGDRVIELANEGTDTVLTVVAIYGLRDNVENLTFTYAEGGSSRGLGNALANAITGGTGADTLLGLDGNDTLLGMGGSDVLNGGLGNDLLNGGIGADTMVGGTGDDVFIVDNLGDIVREGAIAGNDRVESSVTFTISAGIEELTLTGAAAINGTGSRIANILTGNSGDNILFGAGGADTLLGMGGSDTLNGGTGQDRLTGGLGGDTFLFASNSSASLGSTVDVVTDFSRSEGDKLAFSKTIFAGLGAVGGLEAAAFQTGTAALDTTDRIIYNQTTGELFYDADGNGRRAQVLVATIGDTVHSALAFDDFLIMA